MYKDIFKAEEYVRLFNTHKSYNLSFMSIFNEFMIKFINAQGVIELYKFRTYIDTYLNRNLRTWVKGEKMWIFII